MAGELDWVISIGFFQPYQFRDSVILRYIHLCTVCMCLYTYICVYIYTHLHTAIAADVHTPSLYAHRDTRAFLCLYSHVSGIYAGVYVLHAHCRIYPVQHCLCTVCKLTFTHSPRSRRAGPGRAASPWQRPGPALGRGRDTGTAPGGGLASG